MSKLKAGDIVEVLQPSEILKTLDSQGTLHSLPFMPEMINSCGKMYRVKTRIEKTCVTCLNSKNIVTNKIKEFVLNDVVYLENVRCDGSSHGDCQTGCMIFWKEAWLKKTDVISGNILLNYKEAEGVITQLKIKENNKKYFCQATQLHLATRNISMAKKLLKLITETLTRQIELSKAFTSVKYPILRKMIYDKEIKGNQKKTPTGILNLLSGELVEIKSFDEILDTVDKHGKNRGLSFYHDMKKYCGKQFIVRNRLERMIDETTGEMMEVRNTVILDEVICSYEYAFMGCPRARFQFWREIWLRRVKN